MTLAENNTLKSTRSKTMDLANGDVAIHEKITRLKDEVKTLGASLAETGSGEAKRALEKGEELAHDAVIKSRAALDLVSAELENYEAQLIKRVREKPIQSMGFAIGAGFILAYLLRK
jgi:ElaB/YqjD/DUF883 family membrane-anchored ribosome-binding protein